MTEPLTTQQRRVRLLELLLVMTTTFAPSIALSFYVALTHADFNALGLAYFNFRILDGFILAATSLSLLGYVLWRQGRTWASIGLTFAWKDVPRAIGLGLLVFAATCLWQLAATYLGYWLTGHSLQPRAQNVGFMHSRLGSARFFLLTLYSCVNPFHEELPVRAFLMTEVRALSGRWRWAVLASVAVQTSYHFYQGTAATLSYVPVFLIFAVYYARAGRIWPVILAHLFFDVDATFESALH